MSHVRVRLNRPGYGSCKFILSLEVSIREGETQESLLHRFQKIVQMSGVLREAKSNRHFISRGEAARIKAKKNAQRKRRQGY
jgi:ribosomal protein S21